MSTDQAVIHIAGKKSVKTVAIPILYINSHNLITQEKRMLACLSAQSFTMKDQLIVHVTALPTRQQVIGHLQHPT